MSKIANARTKKCKFKGITLDGKPLSLETAMSKMDPEVKAVYREEVGKKPRKHITTKKYQDKADEPSEVVQWPKDLIALENAYARHTQDFNAALNKAALPHREVMTGFLCSPEFRDVNKLCALCNEVALKGVGLTGPSARSLVAELTLLHRGKMLSAFMDVKVIDGVKHYRINPEAIKVFNLKELLSMSWHKCPLAYYAVCGRSAYLGEALVAKRDKFPDKMVDMWWPDRSEDEAEPSAAEYCESEKSMKKSVEEVVADMVQITEDTSPKQLNISVTLKVDVSNLGNMLESLGKLLQFANTK